MRSGRRVLVDECVPHQVLDALTAQSAISVLEMGWTGVKNGSMLELAAGKFEVVFTVDKSFAGLAETVPVAIGVVILHVRSTDSDVLLPYMSEVNTAIEDVEPGRVRRIS